MLNKKEFNQAEELSQCLDHFNNGKYPMTQDVEIKKLVEMASLVKQSNCHEGVPQLLISQLVDNLAAELRTQKKQKSRTHWLYGGLVGTVAAVIIAAFVQFLLPQSADNNIAQQFDHSVEVQKSVEIADQGSGPIISQATDSMIGQQVQSENMIEASRVATVEKKATEDLSKVNLEIIQVPQSLKIDENPNQVAMLQQEKPKAMARTNSVLLAKPDISSLQAGKKSQLERVMTIMVLTNQITQSMTVDNINGVIRQVYNQGTNGEIIITQRLFDESMAKTSDDVKQGDVPSVAEKVAVQRINKDTMNSLTVKVDKYYITIEGQKTKEELLKIIESLTVMK